jgi:hypothetical protein
VGLPSPIGDELHRILSANPVLLDGPENFSPVSTSIWFRAGYVTVRGTVVEVAVGPRQKVFLLNAMWVEEAR